MIKRGEERRLIVGHPWIFSNEVDPSTLKTFTPGEIGLFVDFRDKPLASGFVNPHALIAGRVLSRKVFSDPAELVHERLTDALGLREKLFDSPHYRLCFGESDSLPGLVVDRFGDDLVVQTATAGMDRLLDAVVAALDALVKPRSMTLKNDGRSREIEGLEKSVRTLKGEIPESVEIVEHGATFRAPLIDGQKTAWFYDLSPTRRLAAQLAGSGSVLDAFSYVGGMGIGAAVQGAESALLIDASATATEYARQNAARLGVEDRVEIMTGDAFTLLAELKNAGRRFDLVHIDPPALVKRRKDLAVGRAAYVKLNAIGLALVKPGGFLVTSSCSRALEPELFRQTLAKAVEKARVRARIVRFEFQGADHPILPAMPESLYLKTLALAVG